MSEIDDSILAAIQERADGGVRVEELLAGARRRGGRRRRIRQTLLGAGAVTAVLATVGTVALVTGGGAGQPSSVGAPTSASGQPTPSVGGQQRSPTLGELRPPLSTTALPVSTGGRVGTDRRLLHLDVDDPAASELRWWSGPLTESLVVTRAESWNNSFDEYRIFVGPSRRTLDVAAPKGRVALPGPESTEPVTVDGRPATLALSPLLSQAARHARLSWEQAPGVWVEISVAFDPGTGNDVAHARSGLLQVAQWLRFDRVHRCVVNFRLTWVPDGAVVDSCAFDLRAPDGVRSSAMGIRVSDARFEVFTLDAAQAEPVTANIEVGGRPMEGSRGRIRYGYGDGVVQLEPGRISLGPPDAQRVIGGFEPVAGRDPATWPDPVLG